MWLLIHHISDCCVLMKNETYCVVMEGAIFSDTATNYEILTHHKLCAAQYKDTAAGWYRCLYIKRVTHLYLIKLHPTFTQKSHPLLIILKSASPSV